MEFKKAIFYSILIVSSVIMIISSCFILSENKLAGIVCLIIGILNLLVWVTRAFLDNFK